MLQPLFLAFVFEKPDILGRFMQSREGKKADAESRGGFPKAGTVMGPWLLKGVLTPDLLSHTVLGKWQVSSGECRTGHIGG